MRLVCIAMLAVLTLAGCKKKFADMSVSEIQTQADAGDAFACVRLGQLYAAGARGVTKDEKKAVELYKKSADMGCIEAQCHMGNCHENGLLGVAENIETAKEWYTKAAAGTPKNKMEKVYKETAQIQLNKLKQN